jgi:putative effector of murein hydrolase
VDPAVQPDVEAFHVGKKCHHSKCHHSLGHYITQVQQGDVSIAVVVIVLTGIIGDQYGRRLLNIAGIQDPVTCGLAVGSAAQGLGVSNMASRGQHDIQRATHSHLLPWQWY